MTRPTPLLMTAFVGVAALIFAALAAPVVQVAATLIV
jgi:hypothetical protein